MKEAILATAEDLQTHEQYATHLLMATVSLKTLESYQVAAYQKGLLDEEEEELGKTICWEINRLLMLYLTQIKNMMDRTNINEEEIWKELKKTIPNLTQKESKDE
jgi:hypothetical protein